MSHRPDLRNATARQRGRSNPGNNATVPQTSIIATSGSERAIFNKNRSSIASTVSAGHGSTDSSDGAPPTILSQRHISAIPRATTSHQGAKMDASSSFRSRPNLLGDRKPVVGNMNQSHQARTAQTLGRSLGEDIVISPLHDQNPYAVSRPVAEQDHFVPPPSSLDSDPNSILGVAMPERMRPSRPAIVPPATYAKEPSQEFPPRLIPELQALAASNARAASAQPPSIGSISSPSTLFTESPGTWSSRNTTPTSLSSYSPGIVLPSTIKVNGKRANTVPVPAVSKSKLPRLPALPETLHASNSTAGKYHSSSESRSDTKKKRILASPAPIPPPRASSVKKKKSTGDDKIAARIGDMNTPPRKQASTTPGRASPLDGKSWQKIERIGQSLETTTISHSSGSGGAPVASAPSRPSREGVTDLEPRKLAPVSTGFLASRRDWDHQQQIPAPSKSAWTSNTRPNPMPEAARGRGARDMPTKEVPKSTARSFSSSRIRTPASDDDSRPGVSMAASTSGRSPSTSRLGKLSKFSIFGKSSKQSNSEASPRNVLRKGPAAGTGHEGYGRFARRGRKSSMDSSQTSGSTDRSESSLERLKTPLRGRKRSESSQRDRSSQSDLDEFAAQRMRPIFIRGGSARRESEDAGAASGVLEGQPHSEQFGGPLPIPPGRYPRVSEALSAYSASMSSAASISGTVLSEPWPLDYGPPTQVLHGNDIFGPGNLRSARSSQASMGSSIPAFASPAHQLHKVDAKISPKPEKSPRKIRWNIFHRKNVTRKQDTSTLPRPNPLPTMAVRVSTGPAPRLVPYYAVMDSESENTTHDNLGEFITQAVSASPPFPNFEPAHVVVQNMPSRSTDFSHPYSTSAPTYAYTPAEPPWMDQPRSDPEGDNKPIAQTKKRRLAAVGRIPRVVSSKGSSSGTAHDQIANQSLSTPTSVGPSNFSSSTPGERRALARREFLRFPSKHTSEISASSSSTGLFSTAPPTIPYFAADDPFVRGHNGEDEVWNEYDDFLDRVMSPVSPQKQGLGAKAPVFMPPPHASTSPSVKAAPAVPPFDPTRSITSTLRILTPDSRSREDTRLTRSRIVSALHSSMDPSSPFTIADYLSENGDWLRYSAKLSERQSSSSTDQPPISSKTIQRAVETSTTQNDHNQQHNAVILDTVARTRNPVAQSELHLASLMISRWLSFGRVLFSPAHDQVSNVREQHILVLDGLGSVDWSIFCSVTYSSQNAFVHDLKERDAHTPFEAEHAPPNYRRAEVPSWSERFPFPPSFFAAIVLRFPPVMSDRQMSNIIGECKRVLASGGYLELMLLDLDIVNMGNYTRKAMRDLKIRITSADRAISLKPLSDNIQSHLGQHGFPSLSRCIVGVPVAGKPSGSLDDSSSSRSSGDSYVQLQHSKGPSQLSEKQAVRRSHRPHGQNFSLSDLVADHSENADAKIGKMVSRTARSWWQHCFEASVIPDGDLLRSIFADKTLMKECKTRGSNFKLLIAYTQKPIENRRRTLSEPSVSTLATAGLRGGKKPTS